jgi:hypothetical protein
MDSYNEYSSEGGNEEEDYENTKSMARSRFGDRSRKSLKVKKMNKMSNKNNRDDKHTSNKAP